MLSQRVRSMAFQPPANKCRKNGVTIFVPWRSEVYHADVYRIGDKGHYTLIFKCANAARFDLVKSECDVVLMESSEWMIWESYSLAHTIFVMPALGSMESYKAELAEVFHGD